MPLALLLIFVLLYFSLGAARDAWLVFTGVPFAAVGGIATTLFYLAVALFLWFTLAYVFWARRRLLRGWALVRGDTRQSA